MFITWLQSNYVSSMWSRFPYGCKVKLGNSNGKDISLCVVRVSLN